MPRKPGRPKGSKDARARGSFDAWVGGAWMTQPAEARGDYRWVKSNGRYEPK